MARTHSRSQIFLLNSGFVNYSISIVYYVFHTKCSRCSLGIVSQFNGREEDGKDEMSLNGATENLLVIGVDSPCSYSRA